MTEDQQKRRAAQVGDVGPRHLADIGANAETQRTLWDDLEDGAGQHGAVVQRDEVPSVLGDGR